VSGSEVGDQARIENALPIMRRIKAAIKIEVGSTEIQTNLFGHFSQRFQAFREQDHVGFIDRRHGDRR